MSAFPAQSAAMRPYLDFMRHVRDHGLRKDDRTGTGTLSVFGYQMRFDLGAGFPLLTTKKVHTRSIVHELLWFLAGDTNVRYLREQRRDDLGRVGRRERRSRARSTATSGARGPRPTGGTSTSSPRSSAQIRQEPGLTAPDRHRRGTSATSRG